MTGGPGNDSFIFSNVNEAGDLITDFTTTAGADADILDLRTLFSTFTGAFGTTAASATASGHLFLQQFNVDTLVWVDANGGAHNPGELVFLAQLQNTNATAALGSTLVG